MMLFVLNISCLFVLICAKEYINENKVSWEKATKSCKLPEYYMLLSSNDARDKNGVYAWTATQELSLGWAFFKGCIDINISNGDTRRLSDYFSNSNGRFIAVRGDVFQCAFHCTNFNYFVYYKTLCLCVTSIEKYPVIDSTDCVTTCKDDAVFCYSGFGIPLFKYQTDMEMVQPTMYTFSYHCISVKDGYNFDENCYTSSHSFRCNGKDDIGSRINWINAVKNCTNLNTKLANEIGSSSSGVWSRYFRYESLPSEPNNERRKCVAVFINSNKRSNSNSIKWSHYQYRNCSELLPFICMGGINMTSNITSVTRVHVNTNATDVSTTQIPSNSSEKIEIDVIVKVNIVLLMLSIVMIVLFSLRVCYQKKTDPK